MACSRDLTPENLHKWGQLKGIRVIGTGDITHPRWFDELQAKLEPAETGLFSLKKELQPKDIPLKCRDDVSFMLSGEISCIYRKNNKTRKIHCLVYFPDFAGAKRLNNSLAAIGSISSDGRPILGLDAKKLLQMVLDASPDAMLVPAHAWTPHFSIFGSVSGFDSLEECFEELTPHIYAVETGLSSDPAMNWRLSALDRLTLISNSDAHSPAKLGREANIFDTAVSYPSMMDAIKTREGFAGTIEFFPEEGKYHSDGHRDCKVCLTPAQALENNLLCPVCEKKVTVGVLHRIEKLADRREGFVPKNAPPFHSIIPLLQVVAEVHGKGVSSKKVLAAYFELIEKVGNEFFILLHAPLEEIAAASTPRMAEAIGRVRNGTISIAAGYDGEFGRISIFS